MGKARFVAVVLIVFSLGLPLLIAGTASADTIYPVEAGPFWIAEFEMDNSPSGHFSFSVSCNNGTYDVYVVDETNLQLFRNNETYGYMLEYSREGISGIVTISGELTTGTYGIIVNPHQSCNMTFYNDVQRSPSHSSGSEIHWDWIAITVGAVAVGVIATFFFTKRMYKKG
jgi:hypothetical protein